jgi:hypothetical protein
MVQPVSAFVTFTTQEAKERCVKYFYDKDPNTDEINTNKIGFKSLGVELEVLDPPEAEDIIFENLEIT